MRPLLPPVRLLVAILFMTACSATNETPLTPAPIDSGPPPAPVNPGTPLLRAWIDAGGPFVGMSQRVWLVAYASDGGALNTSTAVLSLGPTTSAQVVLDQPALFDAIDPTTGDRTARRPPLLRFGSTGTVTLHAALGALRDSFTVTVAERPALSNALVVDSFEIVEYRVSCGSGCAHFYYVPVLIVREPTETQLVSVIGVEFTMPSFSTGLCAGKAEVLPNSRMVVAGDRYGDEMYGLLTMRTTADSVPPGPASVEMVVATGGGIFSTVRATGPVRRVEVPSYNGAVLGRDTWAC